ncbi:MAG: hypothetical protein ABIZ70_01950 [Gemmatimonadales bacterium]
MIDEPFDLTPPDDEAARPASVLAATDTPVPLRVEEIADERVPEGMRCLGTFLDGNLVARCAVPPGAIEYFERHGIFGEPRQLVLAAREEDPGLRCELYAIVPMPPAPIEPDADDESEPWAVSVPSSSYERAVADASDEEDDESLDDETHGDEALPMAAVLLGQIVRFQRDRKHPESLPLETVDVLARIVSGRVVEVVDKVLEDLLGPGNP